MIRHAAPKLNWTSKHGCFTGTCLALWWYTLSTANPPRCRSWSRRKERGKEKRTREKWGRGSYGWVGGCRLREEG
ncbi:hypothetical protein HOY82DRAFT_561487 [Tuber indicum]|nr:hypothetical protein HOY82DRAFT_561487 [Tuber indicum]